MSKDMVNKIMFKMEFKRHNTNCKKADVKRVYDARIKNDYTIVKKSSFYRLHGGDYCTLLEIMEHIL